MGQAKRYRLEHDPKYFDSLSSLYYFEEFYQFGGHLFDEPEERPTRKKASKEYYEEADRQSTNNVISMLERATGRQSRGETGSAMRVPGAESEEEV